MTLLCQYKNNDAIVVYLYCQTIIPVMFIVVAKVPVTC